MFDKGRADTARPVEVACGRCMGCRIARRREWTMRMVHELQFHDASSFITMTYAVDPGTLSIRDYQLFLKRLRERIAPATFRYFLVGEYGTKLARPHYHAILFGYDFPDKRYWKGEGVRMQYTSALLDEVWSHGICSVGTVTPQSAAYVCGYVCKKMTGDAAKEYYGDRLPEFARMSKNPGIGARWIDKYAPLGVFERDFVVLPMGSPVQVPRYYTRRQPDTLFMREVKLKRRLETLKRRVENPEEYGSARLLAKQTCREAAVKRLERELEQ